MPSGLNEENKGNAGPSAPHESARTIVRSCHYGLPKNVDHYENFAKSSSDLAAQIARNTLHPIEITRHPDFVTSRLTRRVKMALSLQFIAAYPAREYVRNFGEFLQGER
jgi:hypothetical protein